MQYAQWGEIVFDLLSYKEHSEENSFVYARHETIQPPSSLQWMGKELKKIKVTFRFHSKFCNPEESYKKFTDEAGKGIANKLIIAEKIVGNFVVEKISASTQQIDAWGKYVIIDIDVELTEYLDKKIETKKIKHSNKKKKTPGKTKDKKKAEAIITR